MTAIAPSLSKILPETALTPWDELSPDWQQRIAPAIAPGQTPQYLIQPETEEQLAQVIRQAHAGDRNVLICGNGSKLGWGDAAERIDWVISTARLNRLIENAAGDLTLTVEAGTTLEQIQTVLEPHNLFLALDPAYPKTATIGGIIATADAGSLRHRYGGVRDLLLGIQFVRADGEIAKAGGRVVKNVAGYDLMKLFTGGYGTLGLLTQVTLRTYPIPEAFRTVLLTGEKAALEKMSLAIAQSSLSPISQDWLSSELMQSTAQGDTTALALRFGNVEASVVEQSEEVRLLGQKLGLGLSVLVGKPEEGFWADVSDRLCQRTSPIDDSETVLCKFGVMPTASEATVQLIKELSSETKVRVNGGSGLGMLRGMAADWDGEAVGRLRSHCQSHKGFLTVLEAPAGLKQQLDVWGYSGNALPVMQRIKEQFDPKKTLNPGRFVVG